MPPTRFAIMGGGLSGLYAASLLERQGIDDYLLIEARDAFGGRIQSATSMTPPPSRTGEACDDVDRFDLGLTWFWPALQPQLDRLVSELGLERFEQHENGDMLIERSPGAPPMRMRGQVASPTSMRVAGGMEALVQAMRRGSNASRLVTGQRVKRSRCTEHHVELDAEDSRGQCTSYRAERAERVLLAMPPRLAATTIDFAPALPDVVMRTWQGTATWMAPHAKYLALYDTPFWREQGLSGEARSALEPLAEIHDAWRSRPRIETVPLEEAYAAYRRMKSGQVKFRMVLTMGSARTWS